jgi:hypothetical protein
VSESTLRNEFLLFLLAHNYLLCCIKILVGIIQLYIPRPSKWKNMTDNWSEEGYNAMKACEDGWRLKATTKIF